MNYKYLSSNTVAKIDADGISRSSCSTSDETFKAWLALGNIPLPADPPAVPSLKDQAQSALDRSDITMLRCVEAAISVPMAWNTYRKALRSIANGTDTTSTALPIAPAYPAGT